MIITFQVETWSEMFKKKIVFIIKVIVLDYIVFVKIELQYRNGMSSPQIVQNQACSAERL
jgi:hypothetical protein